MSKRISGPPRRPRNPIAKTMRTPLYRQRVERDRKRHPMPPNRRDLEEALEQTPETLEEGAEKKADVVG